MEVQVQEVYSLTIAKCVRIFCIIQSCHLIVGITKYSVLYCQELRLQINIQQDLAIFWEHLLALSRKAGNL
jgi:hypothetical protein